MNIFRKFFLSILFLAVLLEQSAVSKDRNADLSQDSFKVLVFLSETCPICQQMTINLRALLGKYPQTSFVFVFPNYTVSDSNSVKAYLLKYKLEGNYMIDQGQRLTKRFIITHTPEIILLNAADEILYRGKLDNQYEKLGQRRRIITEHYLDDALKSVYSGQQIGVRITDPVGCYIIKA